MSNVEITIDFKDAEGNPSSPQHFESNPDWKSKLDNFIALNDAEVITTSDKMTLIIPYYYLDELTTIKERALKDLGFLSDTSYRWTDETTGRTPMKSSGVNWEQIDPTLEISALVNAVRRIQNTTPQRKSASVIGDILIGCGYSITKQAYAVDYHNSRQLELNGFVWISTDEYEPQTGDIAIFEKSGSISTGHIQVFDGRQWVSDYRQPDFTPDGFQGVKFYLYRDSDVVGEVVPEGENFDYGSDDGGVRTRKDPRPNHSNTDVGYLSDGRGYFNLRAWEVARVKHFAFSEINPKHLVQYKTGGGCSSGQHGCVCKDMVPALKAMLEAAGGRLVVNSSFRNNKDQRSTFEGRKTSRGEKKALETCAPPGYSEHHTGLAIDFNKNYINTSDPPAYERNSPSYPWLRDHAWKFGFVQSFKQPPGGGVKSVDGVAVEGWHWCYVGTDITCRGKSGGHNFPAGSVAKELRKPIGATSRSPRW